MPRSVFISYHHANDQYYCDEFRRFYCNDFESVFSDRSLKRSLNSEDATYIDRTVRENFIGGSSVTIVLCGQATPQRKFVDWEISDTLLYDHGLVGVILPSCGVSYSVFGQPKYLLPARLDDNVTSGYASLIPWVYDHRTMYDAVEGAIARKRRSLMQNGRSLMSRNGPRPVF